MSPSPKPLFGPAGLSKSYEDTGYKNMAGAVRHTAALGLTAFEYQSGRGVRLGEEMGRVLREDSEAYGVRFSIHAPYYISMSSMEEQKRLNSLNYIRQSAEALRRLGGTHIIFHSGSAGKQSRATAMEKAADTLARMRAMLDEEGYEDMHLCPETMGKVGQLGSLEEVLALCKGDKRHIPCVDFGHLYARDQGAIGTKADFAAILDHMGEALGDQRAERFHVHFSRIEYTAGGEKRHLTFEDTQFGPPFEPFIELCHERKLAPVIICESAGTQAEDAKRMMDYYNSL